MNLQTLFIEMQTHIRNTVKRQPYTLILLFAAVSFIGWCAEQLYFLVRWHDLCDRGFLTLPFCTIYGFCLSFVYLLLGTPRGGRLRPLFEKTKNLENAGKILAQTGLFALYFLAAAFIPTAVEFFVALLFDKGCHAALWDYSYKTFSLFGYVSLDQTILWGVLITLAMQFLWDPMYSALENIPQRAAKIAAVTTVSVLLADFIFNIVWLSVTKAPLILY